MNNVVVVVVVAAAAAHIIMQCDISQLTEPSVVVEVDHQPQTAWSV